MKNNRIEAALPPSLPDLHVSAVRWKTVEKFITRSVS